MSKAKRQITSKLKHYRWAVPALGRKVGQVERLDPDDPKTQNWISCGAILPHDQTDPPETEDSSAPASTGAEET